MSATETLLAVTAPAYRERLDVLLRRGAHQRAADLLGRTDWWATASATPLLDPGAALAVDGGELVSLEASGWEAIARDAAADRLVDGYLAVIVSSSGAVFVADESRNRVQLVPTGR